MDLNAAIDNAGACGFFLVYLSLLQIPLYYVACHHMVGIVFTGATPRHWCITTNYTSGNYSDVHDGRIGDTCDIYTGWNATGYGIHKEPCSQWEYDTTEFSSTIVTEWNLVCSRSFLLATAQSVFMAGYMLGCLTMGYLSDRYGRRLILVIASVFQLIFAISAAFVPDVIVFIVLRFFIALALSGSFGPLAVLSMEMMHPTVRGQVAYLFGSIFSVVTLLLTVVAYFVRDWKTLHIVSSLPVILVILVRFFLPESPRWLLVNGRASESEAAIRRIAWWNRKKLPLKLDLRLNEEETSTKATILDLFRKPVLRRHSLYLFYIWTVSVFVYYGLTFNITNLSGNMYANFAAMAAVELVGLPAIFIMHLIGRRLVLVVSMVLAGVSGVCAILVPENIAWVSLLLALVGKAAITCACNILFVFTPEIYPTVVRSIGLMSCSMVARIGGIIAPYFVLLADISKPLPLVVFGIMSLLAGALTYCLPETQGKSLPDTLQEAEELSHCSLNCRRKVTRFSEDEKCVEIEAEEEILMKIG